MEEDIKIMEENLANPKMWASIARKIPGRNQHQVKNRVIALLAKDSCLSRAKIGEIFKNEKFIPMCVKTLSNLKNLQKNTMRENENIQEKKMEISRKQDDNSNFVLFLNQ